MERSNVPAKETPSGSGNPTAMEGRTKGVSNAKVSDFRLAFALALVKSKPPTLSLREHVLQLRRHIKQGRRTDLATTDRHYHIESVGYWKEQCNALKTEETNLKRKIYELEQENELLKVPGKFLREKGQQFRKKQKGNATTSTNSRDGVAVDSIIWTLEPIETALNPFLPIANVVPLLSNLRQLHILINSESPDVSLLSSILKNGCCSLGQILSSLCTNFQATKPASEQTRYAKRYESSIRAMTSRQIKDLFNTIARILNYLVRGVDILTSSEGSLVHGQVAYCFVKLFSDGIDCISNLSSIEVGSAQNDQQSPSSSPNNSEAQETYGRAAGSPVGPPQDVRMHLCHFLLNMIVYMIPTHKTQTKILEGFLSTLLTRIGQRLSFLTFGPDLNDSMQGDTASIRIGSQRKKSQAQSGQGQDWYLVWLLERALPKLYDSSPLCTISGGEGDVLGQRGADALLGGLKTRIQSTLLKGVFGNDAEDFQNGFKTLEPYTDSRSCSEGGLGTESAARIDGPKWFAQALWRLVGWQILARDDLV